MLMNPNAFSLRDKLLASSSLFLLVGECLAAPVFSERELEQRFAMMRDPAAAEAVVAKCVPDLVSDNFAERQAAERELAQLYWLPSSSMRARIPPGNPEASFRLARIAKRAETEGLRVVASIRKIGASKYLRELFDLGRELPPMSPIIDWATVALLECQPKAADGDFLKKQLADLRSEFRLVALVLLARADRTLAVDCADGLIADGNPDLRLQAALLLAKSGDRRGVAGLVTALVSGDRNVRRDAHHLLTLIAGEDFGPPPARADQDLRLAAKPWKTWLAKLPVRLPAPAQALPEFAAGGAKVIRTLAPTYRVGEPIKVHVAELPGNFQDWMTIVKADAPDTSYDEYQYGGGKTSGEWGFTGLEAGDYEVRLYHDWPNGGYVVQARYAFRVLPNE